MSININSNTENLQADIVVIGGGGAGLSAAISAKEAGAKSIIVLEKAPTLGGNTIFTGGIFAVNSPVHKRLGIHVSVDKLFKDKMEGAEWKIDPRLTRDFINKSGDMIRWLEDKGLKINHIVGMGEPHTAKEEIPGTFHLFQSPMVAGFMASHIGPTLVETLVKAAQDSGVQLLFETSGKKILTDKEGGVNGVLAETRDKTLKITAKSVIIAAGGFGGSPEMIEKYFPSHGEVLSNSLPQMTGDGILMAAEAGAVDDNQVSIALIGPHHYPWARSLNILLRRPHVMLVNKNGERYCDESAMKKNALSRQPDKVCYALLDSDLLRDTIQKREVVGSVESEQGESGRWLDELESDFQKDAAEGHAKIADSWDEIAEYIGAKPEVLKATVDQYNSFCDKGYDADFLKEKEYLLPLRTPPYYAILGRQAFDITLGGIQVNNRLEVIGKRSNPISGLYAAGDNAGGCLSIAYQYGGSAVAFAIYSGYVAGTNATKYVSGRD